MKQKPRLILIKVLVIAWFAVPVPAQAQFEGRVVVEWLSHEGADRDVRLLEPFAFVAPSGKRWQVPKDAVVNGASIPKVLWNSIGPPFVGDYRYASVVHDFYCDSKTETWEETHRVFYEASLAGGVPRAKAQLMYAGVYAGGPRWNVVTTMGLEGEERLVFDQESPGITEADLKELEEILAAGPVPLEEIERFIDQRVDRKR